MIENLPLLTPDAIAQRAHHGALPRAAGGAPPQDRGAQSPPQRRALGAERLLLAGVCAAYLVAMAGDLLSHRRRR